MSGKGAYLCTVCNSRTTNHPSHICSQCRRLAGAKPCTNCASRKTTAPDGLCFVCRKNLETVESPRVLQEKIQSRQVDIDILTMRKQGLSFAAIAQRVNLSKTAVYDRFHELLFTSTNAQKAASDSEKTPIDIYKENHYND